MLVSYPKPDAHPVCAAHLHDTKGADPAEALAAASDAGLVVTAAARALVGSMAALG